MAASPAPEPLVVQSHAGPYRVDFDDAALATLAATPPANGHFVVDERVAGLYRSDLEPILDRALLIEASEPAKSLDRFTDYVEALVAGGIRRGDTLVAVGGGVIQDITCFIAATLFRGLDWTFYPTTLLAQADSCIGSKSSINVGGVKNALGTFTPPTNVVVAPHVLETLDEHDVRSGIGEMLKVHAIDGPASFDAIAAAYESLFTDRAVLARFIRASLEIKRRIIELDEFDRGPRNVMNYGHSFGHAIESATDFAIPHGIAVTIGMDMANFVALRLGLTGRDVYERMKPVLVRNARGYGDVAISTDALVRAIGKDKKNVGAQLRLVLPDERGTIGLVTVANDEAFRDACADYLAGERPS